MKDNKTIYIPKGSQVELFKIVVGESEFVKSPYLLTPFFLGSVARVGSMNYWQTSSITDVIEVKTVGCITEVVFETRNSVYSIKTHMDNIQYKDDLTEMADLTINDLDSDLWQEKLIEKFSEFMNEE